MDRTINTNSIKEDQTPSLGKTRKQWAKPTVTVHSMASAQQGSTVASSDSLSALS